MNRACVVAAFLAALVLLLAGVPARGEAVAVFNFQMTSETPEWRWLEKGLADRVATDFAQDRSQTIIARDEMQLVAQKMGWVPEMATTDAGRMGEIRKQLKIAYLVTGVYEVAGDRIRLIGQVVEVEGRREVARKELAGPAAEVLDLQRRLSAELLAWFSKKPAAQILETLPVWTRSLPAARALYEGMDLYDQGRYGEAWLRFRQASREDPAYVEAVYWVGKMYYFMDRYEHARRMLERFVYLDNYHPRVGDAMVEYVHTYESAGAPAEALLRLYGDLARRFPNAKVWQGPRWGFFGDLRSEDWFRYRCMNVITQLGRAAEVLTMSGPILDSPMWYPTTERGCAYPYGLVSLLEHHARTGQLPAFTIGIQDTVLGAVTRVLAPQEEGGTWLRFDDAGSPLTVQTVPRRLIGEERAGLDRGAVLEEPWATLQVGLRAPSGAVFESVRFQAAAEGDQGYLEVRLRRADTFEQWLGYTAPTRADLKQACRQGIEVKAPPLGPIVVAECRFSVADAQSGPIVVKGITVTPRLARIRTPGALRVFCHNTSDFRVYVDGALGRWNPGLVGPLAPGKHAVRFAPVAEGTPFGEWATKVEVRPGGEARLAAALPWAEGSPWRGWRPMPVPAASASPDPSLWLWSRGPPAIQADEEAIRLVWSCRGDLWSSVSTDGEVFSPPRKLDLPVSSGWDETSPALVRDETGRLVLVFLSCRDARHRSLPYAAWSRDFVHWSAPALICEDATSERYTLLADDRGRVVFAYRTSKGNGVRVSADACRWTAAQVPAGVLMQDRTALYVCYDLEPDKPPGADGAGAATVYRLRRWTSHDLAMWSSEETVGTFKLEGNFPTERLYALEGESGPAILGFGASWEKKWDLGLCEPGPDGAWCVAGRLWGLLPGDARPAYHPRWGYVLAALSAESHEWWPQNPSGPYVLRGPDLKPLREYRSPLPPLALRTPGAKEGPSRTAWLGPDGRLTGVRIGTPFYAHMAPPPTAGPAGPTGTLTYVPAHEGRSASLKGGQHFRPAPAGCGTVHPQARVVTLDLGTRKVALALDAGKAGAMHYDVLRVDPTGRGDFRSAYVVPRTFLVGDPPTAEQEATFSYEFAGDLPEVRFGPDLLAAGIEVKYEERAALGSGTQLAYLISMCGVGACRFGDKTYNVRFYDRTSDFDVRDVASPRTGADAPTAEAGSDWFCVDEYDDGDKVAWNSSTTGSPIRYGDRLWRINDERMPSGRYGQPILVAGRWWNVRVSDDGRQVTAEPLEVPMAHVRLGHPSWHMILVREGSLLSLRGGAGAVPVPAGRYRIHRYEEYLSPAPDFAAARLALSEVSDPAAPSMTLDLKAGTTADVPLGSPLRSTVQVTRGEKALKFVIALRDVAGRPMDVERFHPGELGHMCRIQFTLTRTSDGRKVVYEAARHEAADRGWTIPAGCAGSWTVTAQFSDTFPIEVEPATVTIP